ncbi:carbohydrate ABC transporter permease [Paenibacillaceae bacterium WGS1546]|uniref:carbohydrate ABC transporter permease n=1 Tax=Cohnella sp. WGS1546 TaxID=3366810 RepID=UPI00372CFEBF
MKINKIKEPGQKSLTIVAYFITFGFIALSFFPFLWMATSSLKDNNSVYKFPPEWAPKQPKGFTFYIDYGASGLMSEEEAKLEAMKAIWYTWKKFQLESIGEITAIGIRDDKLLFKANARNYQFSAGRSSIVPSQNFTDNLMKSKLQRIDAQKLSSFAWYGDDGADYHPENSQPLSELGGKIQSFVTAEATYLQGKVVRIAEKGNWLWLFDNYAALWKLQQAGNGYAFHHYLGNSLFVAAVSVALQLAVGALAGYALSRLIPAVWAGVLTLFFVATIMIPEVAILVPLYLTIEKLNLVNSLWGIILPHAAWGIIVYLFKGFFDQLPGELIQAARMDGAGELRLFARIIIPMSLPIFTVVGVMTFLAVWNEFLWPLVVARSESVWTFTVALNNFQTTKDANMVMATLVISTVPLLLVFLFCQKLIEKGVSWTGVKG